MPFYFIAQINHSFPFIDFFQVEKPDYVVISSENESDDDDKLSDTDDENVDMNDDN